VCCSDLGNCVSWLPSLFYSTAFTETTIKFGPVAPRNGLCNSHTHFFLLRYADSVAMVICIEFIDHDSGARDVALFSAISTAPMFALWPHTCLHFFIFFHLNCVGVSLNISWIGYHSSLLGIFITFLWCNSGTCRILPHKLHIIFNNKNFVLLLV
jgi:hypothetical protein